MEIARPYLLFLLLLLPLLYFGHRRSLVDLGRWQRRVSFALRCIIIILLILSLAGLQFLKTDDRLAIVFLADISDSISDDGLEEAQKFIDAAIKHGGGDSASVVAFTDSVQVIRGFADENSTDTNNEPKTLGAFNLAETREEWLAGDEGAGDATDIAQGIEMAWGIFPADTNRRIVLISDGTETHGNGIRAGLRGKTFGVQLDAVPIYPSDVPEVVMKRLDAPAQVKQGEPFHLEVYIHSNREDFAEIRLHKNKFEVAKREVRLKAGENRFSFDQTAAESGMLTFDAICRSIQDTRYDNNHALGIVVVSGTPKVLVIDENESQARHLVRVLEDVDIQVNVRNGLGVPNQLSDLQNYDLLLFSDVPANRLNQRQMELIRTYVQDLGGGFMMLGSENSFGLGGYYKTPIEEILPVRTDTEKKKETPSIGMVLVIDKSGSMSGIKVELAKEAARATVELLGRRDKLGVIAFDGSPHWIAEMHTAADKLYLSDQIGSIRASGGTNLYPALQQAYLALTETKAKLKHVIVLSDGHSQSGDWYGIVNSMRGERITVSTVGIGSGADMNLMSNIADWGNGRAYFTQDAYSVPQIFAKETVTASKSAIIDDPFVPQVVKFAQVLQGIDLDFAPFLLGYVSTHPRLTADVYLVSDRGDPVLASWQYGLGRSVAFTSDAKRRWATDWLEWPGYGKFWTQLVRDTMRKSTASNFQADIEQDKGAAFLTVDALNAEGEFLNELENEVSLISPNLKKKPLAMAQSAPGQYKLSFPVNDMGAYFINVMQKQHGEPVNTQVTGTVVSYPEEYLVHTANESLLKQLAAASGGKFAPLPEDVFRAPENPVIIRVHLWRILLAIAAFLLLLDIALRRIDFRRSSQLDFVHLMGITNGVNQALKKSG